MADNYFLYQQTTTVLLPLQAQAVHGFQSQLPDPVRRKASMAALVSMSFFVFDLAAVAALPPQLPDPVRRRPRAQASELQAPLLALAAPVLSPLPSQLPDPVRRRAGAQPPILWSPLFALQAAPAFVPPQLLDPVRPRRWIRLPDQTTPLLALVAPVQPMGWFFQPGDPVRAKRRAPPQLLWLDAAPIRGVPLDRWYQQPSEPVRRRVRIVEPAAFEALLEQVVLFAPQTIVEAKAIFHLTREGEAVFRAILEAEAIFHLTPEGQAVFRLTRESLVIFRATVEDEARYP